MGNYCLFHSMFAYFILALISMNMRILSGFLFLIASIITLPLVLLFVTLIIPIFFFIIAIMMFARKSKVETVPMYGPSQGYEPHYYPRDEYNDYDDRYYGIEILMTTMVTIIITSMTIMNKTMWNHHIKLKIRPSYTS